MFARASSLSNVISKVIFKRQFASSSVLFQQTPETPIVPTREITKDRTEPVPLETSIRYLKSAAYQQTYGTEPVWVPYRRNHKGTLPPRHTRRTCIRGGKIATGSPCPICRDEYLVLHEENTNLLRQFISPFTGGVLGYDKTGLCRKQQTRLEVCIKRAYDQGLLVYDVPFRQYDYSQYYPEAKE